MRVMVMVKATADSEAGVMPGEQLLADMGRFNEELVKAGVMLAGEGLHPSAKGVRVRFSGDRRSVVRSASLKSISRSTMAPLAMRPFVGTPRTTEAPSPTSVSTCCSSACRHSVSASARCSPSC